MGFAWIMSGPIAVLNGTANRLLGLLGIDPPGETERLHSPEEIRMLVEQSTEGGSLGGQDARLLEGVFEFSEKTAQDVMTPRTQIAALEQRTSRSSRQPTRWPSTGDRAIRFTPSPSMRSSA